MIEVRTGEHDLMPIYRTARKPVGTLEAVREEARSVLDKAFGKDGEKKCANILKLRETLTGAWEEDGASRLAFERFTNVLHA